MTFRQEIGQPTQAIDLNQRIGQLAGYGSVKGGDPSIGARPFAIDLLDATTIIGGETITLDATSIDLADYAIPREARKVVIYIAPIEDGDGGEYRVAAGEPTQPKPEGASRFDTFEPSPPDLSSIPAVPVVEVWLGANAQNLTDDDYRDRRFESLLTPRHLSARTGSFDTVIDGAGVRHDGGLGSLGTTWEDLDTVEVINSDPNHGTDAPHNYFSGEHRHLSGISADDHHARRTAAEDRDAIRGSLDASELAGDSADTPGMHLAVPDGADTQWVRPPRAEAPVIASGTETHTGGSDTTVVINDVAPSQISTLSVSVGEATVPSWSGDYAYSETVNPVWDSAAQTASVEINLLWTNDPGTGNDLEIEYTVVDMDPSIVTELYDNQDAVAALQGSTIAPSALAVADVLEIPVYDTLPDPAGAELGDAIISTGNETSAWGVYQHDGTDWNGPYTAGLTALSDLAINVDKDWNGEPITNVGQATDSGDVLTMGTVQAHEDDESAHHSPTTSSDIDHAQMSNIQPDQHHPPLSERDVGDITAGTLVDVSTTTAQIPSNDSSRVHAVIGEDEAAAVLRGEVSNDRGATPSGLSLEITDLKTQTQIYQQVSQTATGTMDDPLARIPGPREVAIQVSNETGVPEVASGGVSYHQSVSEYGSRVVLREDNNSLSESDRQGLVVELNNRLAGFRVEISDNVRNATTAYIQEAGGGDGSFLAQKDISHLGPGDEFDIRSSRPIEDVERVFVTLDAGGGQYTRGRGGYSGQFPYTSVDFDVTAGVHTNSGDVSDFSRYNFDEITAIR